MASSLVSPCVLPTGGLVCAKGEMSTGGGRVGCCSRVHLIAKKLPMITVTFFNRFMKRPPKPGSIL